VTDQMHRLRSRRPFPDGSDTLVWSGTAVMGIVNVTPDSFSDGGEHLDPASAVEHARALARAGALVVDIGGVSTRPGSMPVDTEEEWRRIAPVLEPLIDANDVIISVDTSEPVVAKRAVDLGAHLINDVTGLRNPAMVAVCAESGTPAIVMHMLGSPATMQDRPHYDDVVDEVRSWLAARTEHALDAGVPSVMVDPGIGFGKLLGHNVALLRSVDALGPHPVLVGASRKRFLGDLTGIAEASERDTASIAAHLYVARRGAAMVRVHDVAGHVAALAVDRAIDTT
jgi:dihydropteroate synthase